MFYVQERPQISPLIDAVNVNLTEVTKTQNFKHCTKRVGFNFFSGFENVGVDNLSSLLSVSTLYFSLFETFID
jgi:hypothetical protein